MSFVMTAYFRGAGASRHHHYVGFEVGDGDGDGKCLVPLRFL